MASGFSSARSRSVRAIQELRNVLSAIAVTGTDVLIFLGDKTRAMPSTAC